MYIYIYIYIYIINNCTVIRYSDTQAWGMRSTRFGLYLQSSGRYSTKKNTIMYIYIYIYVCVCVCVCVCVRARVVTCITTWMILKFVSVKDIK
jgi:hypothetical protein